jgi:hypothetical protein
MIIVMPSVRLIMRAQQLGKTHGETVNATGVLTPPGPELAPIPMPWAACSIRFRRSIVAGCNQMNCDEARIMVIASWLEASDGSICLLWRDTVTALYAS